MAHSRLVELLCSQLLAFPCGNAEGEIGWAPTDDARQQKSNCYDAQHNRKRAAYLTSEIQDSDDNDYGCPDDPVKCSHVLLHV